MMEPLGPLPQPDEQEVEDKLSYDELSDAQFLRYMAEYFSVEQDHSYGRDRLLAIAAFIDAVVMGDPAALIREERRTRFTVLRGGKQ